jgi:hypothetical protein
MKCSFGVLTILESSLRDHGCTRWTKYSCSKTRRYRSAVLWSSAALRPSFGRYDCQKAT